MVHGDEVQFVGEVDDPPLPPKEILSTRSELVVLLVTEPVRKGVGIGASISTMLHWIGCAIAELFVSSEPVPDATLPWILNVTEPTEATLYTPHAGTCPGTVEGIA